MSRIGYISAARVIGIVLVVLGHSYPFDVPIPQSMELLRTFIYSFHMPLFILISGFLAARSNRNAGDNIAVRARKLLIPYFVLSLAAFIPKMLVQQFLNDSVEFSFVYLIRSELVPRENVWGHFWYIPMVFFFNVLSGCFGKQLKENIHVRRIALLVSYLLLWMPETTDWLALEDMRINLFYYVLGFVLSCSGNADRVVANKLWLIALPAAMMLLLAKVQTVILSPVLMSGFVLCLGTLIKKEPGRLVSAIEKNSFTIFLLSWPAQAVVEVVLNRILHLPVAVTMVCMFAAGITIPLLCVYIVKRLEKNMPLGWLKAALGM